MEVVGRALSSDHLHDVADLEHLVDGGVLLERLAEHALDPVDGVVESEPDVRVALHKCTDLQLQLNKYSR